MRLYAIVFSACLLLATPNLVFAQTPEEDAYKVVQDWAKALDDGNVGQIVSKYADAPLVLFFGTKSTILATTKEDRPAVSLCEHKTIKVSDDAVLFAGFYDFTLKGGPVYARYSFLMLHFPRPDLPGLRGWFIAHHHSAAQPAGAMPCLK